MGRIIPKIPKYKNNLGDDYPVCCVRFAKKINERGTVTLPVEVREVLSLEEGDIVEFEVLRIARKANAPSPKTAAGNAATTAETPTPGGPTE